MAHLIRVGNRTLEYDRYRDMAEDQKQVFLDEFTAAEQKRKDNIAASLGLKSDKATADVRPQNITVDVRPGSETAAEIEAAVKASAELLPAAEPGAFIGEGSAEVVATEEGKKTKGKK